MNHQRTFLIVSGMLLAIAVLIGAVRQTRATRQAVVTRLYLPLVSEPTLPGVTTLESRGADGTQGSDHSLLPGISDRGRLIVFQSLAPNLAADDGNGTWDIFVRDRPSGAVELVSRSSAGRIGNRASRGGVIASGGRFVAFYSLSSNLVPGDNNNQEDIFVHDLASGQTILISRGRDSVLGDGPSAAPALSADGRFVAYFSAAANLVDGDDNGQDDIFVHDRQTGQTTLVSRSTGGDLGNQPSLAPAMSADGRFVAFQSYASNLVADDNNNAADIFLHDRQTGETTLVSRHSNGNLGSRDSWDPALSAGGRFLAFVSASNLADDDDNLHADIFLFDRQTGQTTLISRSTGGAAGDQLSGAPAISASGRIIAFQSYAANLVDGDDNEQPDIFTHDRQTGETQRVSLNSAGQQADGPSSRPALDPIGRLVIFDSTAANLVSDDDNNAADIFLHTRGQPVP